MLSESIYQIANCNCDGTDCVILVETDSHAELAAFENAFKLKNIKIARASASDPEFLFQTGKF